MRDTPANLVKIWIALLVLLALTAGSAWLPLGPWNSVANLLIAVAKVLLVLLFFMRLASAAPVLHMVAITAVSILGLLLLLSGVDFFTRRIYRAPWDTPPPGQTTAGLSLPATNGFVLARSVPDRRRPKQDAEPFPE